MFERRWISTIIRKNECLPIVILIIAIFLFIHYSNKKYEHDANQYMLIEQEINDSERCPLYPETLKNEKISTWPIPKWEELENHIQHVQIGGFHSPSNCISRQELAIIIPYRNRLEHLKLLLKYLHQFLQRQKRLYRIFVVEQIGNDTFNKGEIMNIAFSEALKLHNTFDCFIFHDVDLIPEIDLNVYECESKAPRHLSPAVDELRYVLMYNILVGGVLALTKEQFIKVNGWSNMYWGWGGEDDDMSQRIINASFKLSRPPNHIGRYKMIRHEKRERAVNRRMLLRTWFRYHDDGIKQIAKLNYTVKNIEQNHLYTNISVDIGPKPNITEQTFMNIPTVNWGAT